MKEGGKKVGRMQERNHPGLIFPLSSSPMSISGLTVYTSFKHCFIIPSIEPMHVCLSPSTPKANLGSLNPRTGVPPPTIWTMSISGLADCTLFRHCTICQPRRQCMCAPFPLSLTLNPITPVSLPVISPCRSRLSAPAGWPSARSSGTAPSCRAWRRRTSSCVP